MEVLEIPAAQNTKTTLVKEGGATNRIIFLTTAAACLLPFVSPPVALLTGLVMAQFIRHPFARLNQKLTHFLLQASVVGLGFGMNMNTAMQAGREGFLFAIASISGTLLLGYVLGRVFKIEKKTSYLVSAGSAICGGSAIASVAPVIKAGEQQISVALGTVFILNSAALFLFPFIAHHLHLSQTQFGFWCAIAIHDTSSVVGAAAKYGTRALEIATTVKLARALWIIPVAFFSSLLFKNKDAKIKIPYFIGLFLLALLVNTYVSSIHAISGYIVGLAKACLTLTLFLIGSGLSAKCLKGIGFKPLLQAVLLWIFISVTALMVILHVYH